MGVMQIFQGRVAFKGGARSSGLSGITAHSGGGQPSAKQLGYGFSRVETVGAGGDSVKAPSAVVGAEFRVVNAAGSNSMNLFPATDQDVGAGANTQIAVANDRIAIATCSKAGRWDVTVGTIATS